MSWARRPNAIPRLLVSRMAKINGDVGSSDRENHKTGVITSTTRIARRFASLSRCMSPTPGDLRYQNFADFFAVVGVHLHQTSSSPRP